MAEKKPVGRPAYKPTEQDKKTVEMMTACGIPQTEVAVCIGGGMTVKTLRKHFRKELLTARTEANAEVANSLFQQAVNGNTSAAIWWTKARMGWKEQVDQSIDGDFRFRWSDE